MRKGLKMNDTTSTAITGSIATILSFIIAHLPEIQASITFVLTVCFLVYKIREARAKAREAEAYYDNHHGH